MKKNSLNFSLAVFLLVSSVFASGALVGKKANAQKERQGRSREPREQVCLDILAKADEKAQNRQDYINKLDDAIEKISSLDLPEGYEEYESKRQEALAKANELKAALQALFAQYDKVRPTIDCSDSEEALRKVQQAKEEATGRGSVVSQYAPDLDFSAVKSEAKGARDAAKDIKDVKDEVKDLKGLDVEGVERAEGAKGVNGGFGVYNSRVNNNSGSPFGALLGM